MKKKSLAALGIVLAALGTASFASAEIPITINIGAKLLKTDAAPVIRDGRTLVPLRAIFEALGITVDFNPHTRSVTASKNGKNVLLTVDSDVMLVDGVTQKLDVPAMIIGDRTMVPVRACANAFDLDVAWNPDSQTVTVNLPNDGSFGNVIEGMAYTSESDDVNHIYYNENDRQIYYLRKDGSWYKTIFTDNEQVAYKEYSDGTWVKRIYADESTGKISDEFTNGGKWKHYEYDGDRICYYEDNTGTWEQTTYTDWGDISYYNNSLGQWERYEYNGNHQETYYERYDGYWRKTFYADDGSTIGEETPNGYFDYTADIGLGQG